jgi:hypothetical protein
MTTPGPATGGVRRRGDVECIRVEVYAHGRGGFWIGLEAEAEVRTREGCCCLRGWRASPQAQRIRFNGGIRCHANREGPTKYEVLLESGRQAHRTRGVKVTDRLFFYGKAIEQRFCFSSWPGKNGEATNKQTGMELLLTR